MPLRFRLRRRETTRNGDRTKRVFGLVLVAVVVAVRFSGGQPSANQPSPLEVILKATKPEPRWDADKQPIFKALAELAEAQGHDPTNFTRYRLTAGFDFFSGGAYSRKIKAGESEYVIVVQTVEAMSVPGTSAQQLVLLDGSGKILDRLQCHINSRYGRITPHLQDHPNADGSQIILRFDGGTHYWHNWHKVRHGDVKKMFRDLNEREPNEWDQKGLLRVSIRQGRFKIVFPDMTPEGESKLVTPPGKR